MVKGNSLYCKKEMEDGDFGKFRLRVAQGAHGAVGQLGDVRGAADLARNAADLTDADAARAEAAALTARTRSLEIKFEEFQSRMMALETASCSGHSCQSSHPHYDNELDDQSVDEEEDA
ncbi:unnamed protein product [Trifolium pratense]|uniref:Uncharacterized protein n=1 Tax=Trifolium pratense TaxID=57577 RepID=A0ACB0J7N2_TRIPR|nr:unnamed protein product [Trifolium pratense]